MRNVVIIGAGHVGLTLAVDLEVRKEETLLQPHIVQIRETGHSFCVQKAKQTVSVEDIITGKRYECHFPKSQIHKLSDNLNDLLSKTEMVIVAIPDIPELRQKIINWLKGRFSGCSTTVVFVRGGQGGQISLIEAWRNDPDLRNFNFVLVEDSFYGTRYIDRKIAFKRKRKTNISIFGFEPEVALIQVRSLFSGVSIPQDAHQFVVVRPLDLQFDPLGYIIHLGVTLDERNLQLTQRNIQYLHYSDGVHEGNAENIETLDKERVLLAEMYGATARPFSTILSEQYALPPQPSFLQMMKQTKTIYRSLSPSSMTDLIGSRLIQEDVPALLVMNCLCQQSGELFPATKKHTENVQKILQKLDIDIGPLRKYVDELESFRLSRREIIDRLVNPSTDLLRQVT